MSDPHGMDELIEATRAEFEPTRADRERVKRRLALKIGGLGVLSSLTAKAAGGATRFGGLAGGQLLPAVTKVFLSSLLLTLAGASALVAVTRPSPSSNDFQAAPSGLGASAARRTGTDRNAPERSGQPSLSLDSPRRAAKDELSKASSAPAGPALVRPRSTERPAPVSSPPPRHDLDAELALLQQARSATTAGDLQLAFSLLNRLDQQHPTGLLLEERQALRVMASCQSSRVSGARHVDAFLSRYPRSVYAAKVLSACGTAQRELTGENNSISGSFTDLPGTGH